LVQKLEAPQTTQPKKKQWQLSTPQGSFVTMSNLLLNAFFIFRCILCFSITEDLSLLHFLEQKFALVVVVASSGKRTKPKLQPE
jgi:hypothetical protein